LRRRLFWKIGLSYLFLLLLVLAAVYFYTAQVLEDYFLQATFEQLESLSKLVESRPPNLDDPDALEQWADWLAESGDRVTVINADGLVLADSHENPRRMENHADRPEVIEALASGRGRSTRHSDTLNRDLVYMAIRNQPGEGEPVVLRLALPLERVDDAIAAVLRPVGTVSLVVLALGAAFSLFFSRALSLRVRKLEEFSRRVAEGDFRPLPVVEGGDELVELARSLNETAARLDATIRTLRDERNQSLGDGQDQSRAQGADPECRLFARFAARQRRPAVVERAATKLARQCNSIHPLGGAGHGRRGASRR
jgi:two-component system phosphate regulon sensor histidine kinase PhoR